jgi:hypothetical protein
MGRDERVNLVGMPGGVPIIGGGNRAVLQPPEVRDALNRVLHEGDRVVLLPHVISPFHSFGVARITPMEQPGPDGQYGWMTITLETAINFAAVRGQPNAEFARVLQAQPRHAGTVAGEQSPTTETPDPGPEPRA